MSEKDTIEFKDNGLSNLINILVDESAAHVKVGILGNKNSRYGDGAKGDDSNATVGVRHEFGLGVPVRSFLRGPIINKFGKSLEESGGMSQGAIDSIISSGTILPYLEKMGVLSVSVVEKAFDSSGYGKWKESNMTYKKNHQTLVESVQLKKSITYEVIQG